MVVQLQRQQELLHRLVSETMGRALGACDAILRLSRQLGLEVEEPPTPVDDLGALGPRAMEAVAAEERLLNYVRPASVEGQLAPINGDRVLELFERSEAASAALTSAIIDPLEDPPLDEALSAGFHLMLFQARALDLEGLSADESDVYFLRLAHQAVEGVVSPPHPHDVFARFMLFAELYARDAQHERRMKCPKHFLANIDRYLNAAPPDPQKAWAPGKALREWRALLGQTGS